MSGQFRDLDFVLLIALLIFALFVPDIIEGIHNYRRGRDLARQITQEQEARKFLDDAWKRRHKPQWADPDHGDDWK